MVKEDYIPEWRKKGLSKKIQLEPFSFFRNDDVGYQNLFFMEMANFFNEKNIPLNVAIIPSEIYSLERRTMNFLFNKNVYNMQHGFNHSNYFSKRGNYSEFHLDFPKLYNRNNLIKGKKIFCNTFNPSILSFVPPRHQFPPVDILIKEKYKLISGYGNEIEIIDGKVFSIPVNFDIIKNYKRKELYNPEKLTNDLKKVFERDGFLGILLHHNFMPQEYPDYLKRIINFLKKENIKVERLDNLIW